MSTFCRALRLQCAAYADDELGVDAVLEIERHLEGCAGCRRAVARQRQLSRALRELRNDRPPAELASRIRFALFGPTAMRRTAAAGVLVLATAGLGGWLARTGLGWTGLTTHAPAHDARAGIDPIRADALVADPAPAVAAAAAFHREVDDGTLALELTSGDVTVVNAWLRDRLPFVGAIGDPGSGAMEVAGATHVMLGEHPAGLVRYRLHDHTISLFLIAEPVWSEGAAPVRVGSVDFRIFKRRGLDLVGWSHAAISYLLVSEDGLTTGNACAACHGNDARGAIAEFVTAVAGHGAGTGLL